MSSKQKAASTALSGIIGAAIGAIATISVGSFGYFNKDRELDIQMVNVGLSILKGEATGEKKELPARRFALRLLQKYADVTIPADEFEEWAKFGTTPFVPIQSVATQQGLTVILGFTTDQVTNEIDRIVSALSSVPNRCLSRSLIGGLSNFLKKAKEEQRPNPDYRMQWFHPTGNCRDEWLKFSNESGISLRIENFPLQATF